MSVFAASAWSRLLPALGVGCAWLAIELLLARATVPAPPRAAPPAADLVEIAIESTAPVGVWTVVADGVALAPERSDARHWRASARARHLDVRAEPADPLAEAPAALRVHATRAGAGHSWLLWGDGSVAGTVDLERTP